MSTIADRLSSLRDNKSRRFFADEIGTKESTLRNYEQGVTQPSADFLEIICKKLRISPRWLLLGEGPMNADEAILSSDAEIVFVPLVEAKLSAGHGSFETSGENERRYAFRYDFLFRKGNIKDMVLMRVSGDSMSPAIEDGDVVLIDQSQSQPLPGRIYAVGVEDMVYLKRVDAAPGKLVLYSDNTFYEPLEIEAQGQCEDNVRIIGRAVWSAREW